MRPRARLGKVRPVSEFNVLSTGYRQGHMLSEADMRHQWMCSKQGPKGAAVACSWSCEVALASAF